MAIETINIGTSPNDGTGDPLRVAFDKTNDNFLTITADGGNEITVLNPTTATDTDLNVALQNILDAGTGGAVDSVNGQTGVVSIDLESVLTEGNESTTQDAIFRLDADKYIKIDRANQVIQMFDLTIDAVNPISIYNKNTISFIDGTGNETYINAGYINNIFNDGSASEIFGSNILLTNVGTSLNLTNELMELNNGIDAVSYKVDRIIVNGVEYTLPTGATSQIATLLDIPAPITIDVTPTDGSSNAVSSNGVFDALATKQATLVSGTNIKTLEGQSLLGSGNIDLTKSDVGLSNVDNTSDANKPVSTAQQTALDLKANLASPALTGTPTAPTQSANDNSTKIATTAYADAKVQNSLSASTTIAPSATQVNTALNQRIKILSKSGVLSTTVTGTLTETEILKITIPANTMTTTDFLNIERIPFYRAGFNSAITFRVKLSTSATMPATTTDQIAVNSITAANLVGSFSRCFWQSGGSIFGANNTAGSLTDFTNVVGTISSKTFDPTVVNYLYVSVTLGNIADSIYLGGHIITV